MTVSHEMGQPDFEPWAMDALAILARRLTPDPWPSTVVIDTPPRREPSWLDTLIHERMNAQC
jgi:hypothetical protein